jgi:hypothetical protein
LPAIAAETEAEAEVAVAAAIRAAIIHPTGATTTTIIIIPAITDTTPRLLDLAVEMERSHRLLKLQ